MLIWGSLGDLEGSEVSEKDPRGSDVPLSSIVCPLEVFYCTRFGLKHHMIVQLAYLHWAGLTNLFLFAHLGTLKGPQCGIF